MCFFLTLLLLGPRAILLIWWIVNPVMWAAAFDTFIWPLLGFLFLPWTTIMYVLVFPGGIEGLDWLWLGLGLFADIASYGGSAWGNRDQSSPPPTWTTYDGV